MLQLLADAAGRDCAGVSRRDFVQLGALGLGGLSLPWLLEQRVHAAEMPGFVRNRSVVLLFLSGGASHIETFNPNLDGPGPSRSTTGEVSTSVPGLTFGGTFPLLAEQAHHMAVVRSFRHSIGGHVQAIVHLLSGGSDPIGQRQTGFSMGAAASRLRGANHPQSGMPTYALLTGDEVDPQYRSERGRMESGSYAGTLGTAYAPFLPGGSGPSTENMQLRMEASRLTHRRALLGDLDQLKRHSEQILEFQGADEYVQQAFDVILGSAADAFDLQREDPRIRDRYDTSHIKVGKKTFRRSQLGEQMLTARRMIEAGCGFVTVHSAGWDMHADGNNPGIVAGMEMLGRSVDKAVSAFLWDLDQRGMLNDVLLVITGDFGRTPRVNSRGGRDHWPQLGTLAFAGAGMHGQIIGQSTRDNAAPATEPLTTTHMMATVMHSLFDIAQVRLQPGVPRDLLSMLERNEPIGGLVG